MRAWILALVHAVWKFQGLRSECWTDEWHPISTDGSRPRAR